MKDDRILEAKGEFDYDYRNDILFYKVKNRDYDRSIEFNNIVIDIDKEDYVTGIQIFDASEYFSLSKESLRLAKNFKFVASVENSDGNGSVIQVRLGFHTRVRKKDVRIPAIVTSNAGETLPESKITVPVGK